MFTNSNLVLSIVIKVINDLNHRELFLSLLFALAKCPAENPDGAAGIEIAARVVKVYKLNIYT